MNKKSPHISSTTIAKLVGQGADDPDAFDSLMTSNLTIAFMYRVAQHLSERLSGIIQLAAPVTVKYQQVEDETVPWAMGMVRAVKSHPFMADFIVKSGVIAWVKMGPKAFMKLQFMKHKDLLHRVLRPEPMAEHYSGFNAFTAQGTATMAYDVKSSYHDFSNDIRVTHCPILVVHSTNDEMFPIGGAQVCSGLCGACFFCRTAGRGVVSA